MAATEPRIEIVGERRRAYDPEFRARVVEASCRPGTRVQEVAQQYGICVSLIYRWRRSAAPLAPSVRRRAGPATAVEPAVEFVPLGVFGRAPDEGPALVAGPPTGTAPRAAGRPAPAMTERVGLIEIELADGTRLRVDAFVNERALRRVVAVLKATA